jgi:hypothetical protein
MFIKPSNSLNERLLLSILLVLLAHVATNRETMNDTAVEIDLIRLLGIDEDCFGFVTLLGGEDLVGFGGRDRERPLDG